jgi:hypothetical protein
MLSEPYRNTFIASIARGYLRDLDRAGTLAGPASRRM